MRRTTFWQRPLRAILARPLIREIGIPAMRGNRLMTVSGGGQGSNGWMAFAAKAEAKMHGMAIEGSKRIYLYNLKKKLASRSEAFGLEEMFASRVKETYEVHRFTFPLLRSFLI
jgi:hypothetical protein